MFLPTGAEGPLGSISRWARRAILTMAFKSNDDSAWGRVINAIGKAAQYEYPDISLYDTQAMVYTSNPWVYVAVSKISQAAAQLDMYVQTKGSDGLWSNDPGHEIYDLLQKPNSWMSRYELVEATFGSMELSGNAFWFLNGGAGGSRPQDIMPLRPDRVRVVSGPDTDHYVAGYVYSVQGVDIPLDPQEVIHFKRWHPANDLYGFAATIPALVAIQTDSEMAKYNRKFFSKYNGAPSGIVSLPPNLSNAQFEVVKADWLKNHADGERRTSFIRAGSIAYSTTGISQKEMDFLQGRRFERQLIFDVYGIPAALMDSGSTEASSQVAFTQFQELTMWPKLLSFTEKVTSDLASRWRNTRVQPEDIRRTKRIDERAEIVNAGAYLTINEVRTRYYHLPPLKEEWADQPALARTAASGGNQQLSGPQEVGQRQSPTTVTTPKPEVAAATTTRIDAPSDGGTKSLPAFLDSDVLDEVGQFKRFATKRWSHPRRREILDGFSFKSLTPVQEAGVRAWIDIAVDEHDVSALFVKSGPVAITSRVDLEGSADPMARLKGKAVLSLRVAIIDMLSISLRRITNKLRGVSAGNDGRITLSLAKAVIDDQLWEELRNNMARALANVTSTYIDDSALEQAKMLEMSTGISFDPAALNERVAVYTRSYVFDTAQGLTNTMKNGVDAILERWFLTGAASLHELIATVESSFVFASERAQLIAETEATRIFAVGTWLGAEAIALSGNVDIAGDVSMAANFVPAHVACFCWWTPDLVYAEDNYELEGIDFIYHTSKDDRVCHVCAPRHGQLLSGMIDRNDNS